MKKKWKITLRKISKTHNAVAVFIKLLIKNYKCMKNKIKKIWLPMCAALCITATSCHSMRASVRNDAEGSTTTITITTNNPTKTDISGNVNLKGKE